MMELQSCATTLVSASALCGIEQEVKGESVDIVAEISAELQRERQKNADLMQRISMLEAQIRERSSKEETTLVSDIGQGNLKRFKKRKLEMVADEAKMEENGDSTFKSVMASQQNIKPPDTEESRLVNWMGIDDTQNPQHERFKDSSDYVADFDETDSDGECDDNHDDMNNGHRKNLALPKMSEVKTQRNPLKVAFCPKEVKRIIECEALLQKNGQSHTIRKIIVFASLGTRHGCEDMYELDFNHFIILKKGEPYVSPRNPGEHVLYENPGVGRKIFYPNRQNPTLCPVQILEEERGMRPSDASCPSCLFLCIKYGGRTRNLPQNEYVRQRMGRNKLKSFGPLICRMAMLVNIRTGSFFFKALGITLLFMAGFPDDIVQRETKYKNLDLLQKYYRTDEDAQGEELFLPHPIACDNQGTPEPQSLTKKTTLSAKSKGRKHTNSTTKSQNSQKIPSSFYSAMSSQKISQDTLQVSNNHTLYHHMLPPPHPTSAAYMPIMYWPPPPPPINAFPYGCYQSFPSTANYISFQTQPYYNLPTSSSSVPKLILEGNGKNDVKSSDQTDSDSDCSSSEGTQQKQREEIFK